MTSIATAAGLRVGSRHGYRSDHPLVLQETNNTVVWLRPHAAIAKVGKWRHSSESLVREHAVATALAVADAPVAAPLAGVQPTRDGETGFMVTLWERLDVDETRPLSPGDVGESLRQLHDALGRFEGHLPSFRIGLDRARATLADDGLMESLPADDRSLLRDEFDQLREQVEAHRFAERPLHGEPHDRNLLSTTTGSRWIDLEGVCIGPLEWDLAFLPDSALKVFPRVDIELLDLLRPLNSARVATWCWAGWEFAELRWHAKHHLEQVRRPEHRNTEEMTTGRQLILHSS